MLKRTTKLIIDKLRWVFLCRAPAWLLSCLAAVLLSTLRSTPYCFILVAGFLLTPFPLPHLYRFLLELDIKTQTHWDLPRTDLGKLALNFPFNCFALGQDCLKMLKYSCPHLMMRNYLAMLGFKGLGYNRVWL